MEREGASRPTNPSLTVFFPICYCSERNQAYHLKSIPYSAGVDVFDLVRSESCFTTSCSYTSHSTADRPPGACTTSSYLDDGSFLTPY